MARYRLRDVLKHLEDNGCTLTGEGLERGLSFANSQGIGFTLPLPDGREWIDADLTDAILADRWIARAPDLKRYPDTTKKSGKKR